MGLVDGRIALVTGAASGIGRACAERLAAEGAAIVLTDIQDEAGCAVADAITAAGGDVLYIHHDVTNEDAWRAVVSAVRDRYGRLDVLVNNAGVGIGGLVTEMSLELWRKQQAVNVEGVFLGVKHCLPLMRKSGANGSIINISSASGIRASAGYSAYCASKGAVRMFSKAVALECAGDGIRCNSVHPGMTDTPIWQKSSASPGDSNVGAPDLARLAAAMVPLKRPGAPTDIADGVLYLASDMSSYVTGSELVIDGGAISS